MEILYTLAETAKILRVSKSKLMQERRAGRLSAVAFGRSVRVTESEIKRFIRDMQQGGLPPGRASAHQEEACA